MSVIKRWYLTLTWEGWPEGGSFGVTIEAADHDAAVNGAKREMALARLEPLSDAYDGMDEEEAIKKILETYADDWHVVDCFDLDVFIKNHLRKTARQPQHDKDGPSP